MNPLQRLLVAPVLIDGEQSGPLAILEAALSAELQPETAIESILVGKLSADLWRLRRVVEAESLAIEQRIASDDSQALLATVGIGLSPEALADVGLSEAVGDDPPATQLELDTGSAGKRRIAAPADDRLGRYEMRLQASAFAVLRELRTIQDRRKEADNTPPAPAPRPTAAG